MMHVERITPGPGQESVWDFPRPPRVEDCDALVRVVVGGEIIAESRSSQRVLETSHPPVFYLPPSDIRRGVLFPTAKRTWCEWKGTAIYLDVRVGDKSISDGAWTYAQPKPAFEAIRNHVAFYAHLMDACFVNDEQVQAQPGDFYGGWITGNVVGPFKGAPGTLGW